MSGAGRSPEQWLQAALGAAEPALRAKYAQRGLGAARLAGDTRALLLRQLYLSHLQSGRWVEARTVAEDLVGTGELRDIGYRDAATASLALDEVSAAIGYLRLAGRAAPRARRALHLSCLGSLHYLRDDFKAARAALERAIRWADDRKPLYQAQLSLVRAATDSKVDLRLDIERLQAAATLGLFGKFVLAELLRRAGRLGHAVQCLRDFESSYAQGDPLQQAGLRAEWLRVRQLLDELEAES